MKGEWGGNVRVPIGPPTPHPAPLLREERGSEHSAVLPLLSGERVGVRRRWQFQFRPARPRHTGRPASERHAPISRPDAPRARPRRPQGRPHRHRNLERVRPPDALRPKRASKSSQNQIIPTPRRFKGVRSNLPKIDMVATYRHFAYQKVRMEPNHCSSNMPTTTHSNHSNQTSQKNLHLIRSKAQELRQAIHQCPHP